MSTQIEEQPEADMTGIGATYREALISGRHRAAVWGIGYIGASTVLALADNRIRTCGYDTDQLQVTRLAAGITSAAVELTDDVTVPLGDDVLVHFVAVPTERQAEPWLDALADVIGRLARATKPGRDQPPLVIIESTLTPGTTTDVLLPVIEAAGLVPDKDLLLALAPRRDWLTESDKNLRELDRVFGGVGPNSAEAAHGVLSILCRRLHRANSHVEGELVKCVENAYRHVIITMANQLTLAYPQVDLAEVLRLAATKWNVQLIHPSFGTGGYCVPLSSRYLLQGAQHHADKLSLLSAAVDTDNRMRRIVANAVAWQGPVAVFGLAYKGGIKVATLSPTIEIAARLRELGVPHSIHDPLYTPEEIERITGSPAMPDPETALATAGTALVVTDHDAFLDPRFVGLLTAARDAPLFVLDNYGLLEDTQWPAHVRYRRAGNAGWLAGAPR
ncbi:UDP binding domain-containing protein [Dactylosporangium cerinum]|uniref:UDP binding domain-containing protein n=1 Tax=Dactylosporangium cerinum TaxID=1434730 RepID=A0ABV9WH30_9ACTN